MSLTIHTQITRRLSYTVPADLIQDAIVGVLMRQFREDLKKSGQSYFLNDAHNFDIVMKQIREKACDAVNSMEKPDELEGLSSFVEVNLYISSVEPE